MKKDKERDYGAVENKEGTPQAVNTTPRPLVAASQTVPPRVSWEERTFTDKVWAFVYLAAFVAFLGCGFTLVARSHARYEFPEVTVVANTINGIDIYETVPVRVVAPHYQDDVQKCCASKPSHSGNGMDGLVPWDLCDELTIDNSVRRRREARRLQEEEDSIWGPTISKLERGDGMFDAFLDAPEIPITMSFLGLFLALTWIVLLRFFATPIVFATEAIKLAFFLYLTVRYIQLGLTGAAIVAILCALAVIAWGVYTYKQLIFAGKMISYAAQCFKENMELFCAFLPVLILYATNAYLFVTFYAKSFDVVEVKMQEYCSIYDLDLSQCQNVCVYSSPSYTTPMVLYISLAYLWSVLLFGMMRLSIIAHVIGSWHFHPENQPGIGRAIWNTCTTSAGTLSVASLVATIAEKLNRMFLEGALWKHCCNPVFCILMPLYCLFGHCIRMFILMLTKFSVILHVFTGKSWFGSAKKVFKILKRHFKGGFVTEYASSSVLNLGSYVFSIGIYFLAWVWLDREFKTDTFVGVNDSTILIVAWIFFALFHIWYPVLGVYLLIVLNRVLSRIDAIDPAYWVTPFAATFIGCIAMMFFTYLAGVFLDTVDVCFLCFAIDRDNHVDLSNDEFSKLVHEGVDTVITHPDWSDDEDEDEEIPPVVVTGLEPLQPPNNRKAPKEPEITA